MNIYDVIMDSPWLTFFIVLGVIKLIFGVTVQLPNRILRHKNIRLHGYPPTHCDADGDFKASDDD